MKDVKMWLTMIASCALFISSVFAFADTPVSPAEAEKIKAALEAAGCTLNDIVKVTAHLEDIDEFDRYNAVYREFFKGVPVLPARTTVQSVLWNDIKVEIDAVARKPA